MNGTEARRDNIGKLASIYALAWIGSTSHMVGEFVREAAVLLLIFVPLDWWKPNSGDPNFLWRVVEISLSTLCLGMVLEYVSLGANRAKRDLEGNNDGK